MKKKDIYADEFATKNAARTNVPAAAAAATAATGVGTVLHSKAKITDHFKKKGITDTAKGLKYGTKTFGINYEDLMQDLTHNYRADKMNLNPNAQAASLKILRKSGMPASYIRNKLLHDKYVNILATPITTQPTITAPPPIQTAPPPYATGTPILVRPTPLKRKRIFGQPRDYTAQGYLEASGSGV
jgi:hypothetical protein